MLIEDFFNCFSFLNVQSKDFNPSPNEGLSFRQKIQDFDLSNAARRTLNQPYPWSSTRTQYSRMWGYNVLCHPDTHRGPVPLFVHSVSLQLLTVLTLLYLMHLKGESKNYFRMLVYATSPIIALVMLVAPIVFGSLRVLQVVLEEMKNGERSFSGVFRELKQVVLDTMTDSCGPLLEPLPEPNLPISTETTNDEKAENFMEMQPTVANTKLAAGTVPTSLPIALVAPALALLTAVAAPTLLLAYRRHRIQGMILLDEYHAFLALVAILTTCQLVCILVFKPKPVHAVVVTLNTSNPRPVNEDGSSDDGSGNSSDTLQNTVESKRSMALLMRSSCAARTADLLMERRQDLPYRLGQVSFIEILLAELVLNGMFSRHDDTEWHDFTFTTLGWSWIFFTVGLSPIYAAFTHVAVSALLHITEKLAVTISPTSSRFLSNLEAAQDFWNDVPSKISKFLTNVRFPRSLSWMIKNWYFGTWVLIFYPLSYYIMFDDIRHLEDQKWAWGNDRTCFFLWFDPLSETLLWPFYHFNGYNHPY